MSTRTTAERITALETEVQYLRDDLKSVNDKLDKLMELKNKGAGAFWLASALFGTGIIGAATMFLTWFRGHV